MLSVDLWRWMTLPFRSAFAPPGRRGRVMDMCAALIGSRQFTNSFILARWWSECTSLTGGMNGAAKGWKRVL